jgi:hypothetical protein
MPLKAGSSKKTLRQNIDECLDSYRATGKIGTSTPRSIGHAQRICTAMALDKARESGARIPRPRRERQRRRG